MKTKILVPIFGTIALIFPNQKIKANTQLINQEGPGLEISSILTFQELRISDYTLIIYDENQSADTVVVPKMKTLFLKLSYGHIYSLRYVKPGFLDRVVMIDTKILEGYESQETGFDFEIEMIPESQCSNTMDNLPVGLVRYDYSEQKFDYSRNYHRQIRRKEIKEIAN